MNQVSELEKQLSNTKSIINTGKALDRLMSNRDFKSLILDGFCFAESARLVKLSSNSILSVEQRNNAIQAAQAAGHLEQYLQLIKQEAIKASVDILEVEESLEEARLEDNH